MAQRPKVFFELTVNGVDYGRVVIELYSDTAPVAAENFRELCTGEKGKALHYKGAHITHISPWYLIAGSLTTDRNFGQRGGESIYFIRYNRSTMDLLTEESPEVEQVAFGQVVEGFDVLERFHYDGVLINLNPTKPVVISDCGEISERFINDPVIAMGTCVVLTFGVCFIFLLWICPRVVLF